MREIITLMLKNYIITALRALLRNRVTSVINIVGFAAGIAASVMIMLYVFSELSVDRFNEKYDRIYRLEVGDFFVTGTAQALIIKEAFPEVEQAVRMDYRHRPLIRHDDEQYRIDGFVYADSTLFDIFSFKMLRGDPTSALDVPFSLVLAVSEAERIFGSEDPVGKMVKLNNIHDYTVTAIIDDIDNSHLPIKAIASFSSLPQVENDENYDRHLFSYMNFLTYVLLHDSTSPSSIAEKFDSLIDERFPEARRYNFRLRPLGDIYFNGDLNDSPPVRHGNLSLVYALVAIAGFILLIAIVNFINLATANASVRYGEIGVRKAMGAARETLIFQFLTESVILSLVAFLLGIVLVEMLLPVFNDLLSVSLSFNPFYSYRVFFLLPGLVLITGFLAGLYPAFYLSSMNARVVPKGEITRGRRALKFRRALIVLQFTISIALIICTIAVQGQIDFMLNKNLGFNKENIITVRLNRDVYSAADVFRDNLVRHDAIASVSMSNNLPGYVTWFNTWITEGESKPHKYLPVDPEYIDLMGIELVGGRNFDWNRTADQEYTFILNEEAVRYFGFDDPAGKEYMVGGLRPVRIIGVVKDFHFRSLHEPVGPLVLGWQPANLGIASIRINPDRQEEALNYIREQWETISPESFFEYSFLDEEIDKLYRSEIRIGRLFRYFALVAIIIACMGLYGLSSFIANQRTKEIGIRKVLGSSAMQIVILFSSEFAKWVIVANLIAWPLAYMAMDKWLDNFPFRNEPGLFVFIAAGLIALMIALITVSSQAWKTAGINPSHILRNE